MKKIVMVVIAMVMVLFIAGCAKEETKDLEAEVVEVADESATEEAVTEESATEEAVTEEVVTEEAVTEEAVTDESVTENLAYPLTITDKFGTEVVIEKAPEKIISMSPEMTEIVFALGMGDQLIGRSSYCTYPEEAAGVADFGSLFNLNIESIVEAAPDLVLLSSMVDEALVNNLRNQELTVLALDQDRSLEGTYSYIEQMGKVFAKEEAAMNLNKSIKAEIAEVEAKTKGLERPSVYYVVYAAEGAATTATGDTFTHGIITAAGGDNVAKDGTEWTYSVEKLVQDDPWIVICPQGGMKVDIEGMAGYSDLTAVKEGRLFEVNEDIFSRQGPRIGQAVKTLAEIFHPEAFE